MNLGATQAGEAMNSEISNWFTPTSFNSNFRGRLLEEQTKAQEFLLSAGLPTFALEDWKYTSLAALKAFNPITLTESSSIAVSARALTDFDSVVKLEMHNGSLTPSSLSTLKGIAGLKVSSLSTLTEVQQSKIAEAIHSSDTTQAFTSALALANSQDIICIEITASFSPKVILNVEHLQTLAGAFSATYVCVMVGSGASCRIVETFKSVEESMAVVSTGIHLMLEDGAQCKHIRVLEEGLQTHHFSSTQTELQANAKYSLLTCVFGGRLTRNDVRCRLKGSGAHVDLLGVNLLRGNQHVDSNTVLDHVSPHCTSLEVYKGIYADKSKGVFDGTIIVRPDAQKTNAIQSSKALLLSDKANSFSKPQLKIWADDVKCTHGATVGQIDENALFYLRSRGIQESEARSMLAQAFVAEVFTSFSDESLISWINDVSSEYLAELFQG
jgi:Fe-S cluster assembly protein SufD